MLEAFLSYIDTNLSVNRDDKFLLAVSGGMDSMVMLHLFKDLGRKIGVAHINHSTRNGGSDSDMSFVEAFCKEHQLPFHGLILDYEVLKQGNFQENARNQRYIFLEKIRFTHNYGLIATAHHMDDRWETFIQHLNRKSGLQGLTSLKSQNEKLIRPMLAFTRSMIENYAKDKKISFVHDQSNDLDEYKRNALRHHVSPALLGIFPDFISNVNKSIEHLEASQAILDEFIVQNNLIKKDTSTRWTIALNKIKKFKNEEPLLYHMLSSYGFNLSDIKDILACKTTGALFLSHSYEILYDRGRLILRAKRNEQAEINQIIDKAGIFSLNDGRLLRVELLEGDKPDHLCISAKSIEWPLLVRRVKSGDSFRPSGMGGAKKSIKKLTTDLKIDRFCKEDLLLLISKGEIIQIINHRTAHGFLANDEGPYLRFTLEE